MSIQVEIIDGPKREMLSKPVDGLMRQASDGKGYEIYGAGEWHYIEKEDAEEMFRDVIKKVEAKESEKE